MKREELYKKAIETWGIYAQTLVFHEEMAEVEEVILNNSSDKYYLYGNEIKPEIADAMIMVEQMAFSYGLSVEYDSTVTRVDPERAYVDVKIAMSHFQRGRCDFIHLQACLSNLYNTLIGVALLVFDIDETELYKIQAEKLHRLADMLGETYEEAEA